MCSLTYEIITVKAKGNKEFDKIKKLNCWASNLNDVSILKNLPSIEILTLSVNEITSLESLQYCSNLTELYIRNNKIDDLDQIFYLKNLKKLRILWLADNPAADQDNYRLTVIRNLRNLQKLDNITITHEERLNAVKFGNDIKAPPSKIVTLSDSDENLLDIISSTQEFEDLIRPLKDRFVKEKQNSTNDDENEKISQVNHEESIVTELIADNNNSSTTLELNTLETPNELNSSINSETNLESNGKTKSSEKLSMAESNDDSRKSSVSAKTGSNVLPAILLLINELNTDDLQLLINMCVKRQNQLIKL